MKYKSKAPVLCAVSASLLLAAPIGAPAQAIEEIIVTADFRERPASEMPASVTLLDSEAERRGTYIPVL